MLTFHKILPLAIAFAGVSRAYAMHTGLRHLQVDPNECDILTTVDDTLYGLCYAYCIAKECDTEGHPSCESILSAYEERSNGVPIPCSDDCAADPDCCNHPSGICN
jgi:hypothetical protein